MVRFLSHKELAELTGERWVKNQIDWLIDNRFPFETDKNGRPKVLESYLMQRLGGQKSDKKEPQLRL